MLNASIGPYVAIGVCVLMTAVDGIAADTSSKNVKHSQAVHVLAHQYRIGFESNSLWLEKDEKRINFPNRIVADVVSDGFNVVNAKLSQWSEAGLVAIIKLGDNDRTRFAYVCLAMPAERIDTIAVERTMAGRFYESRSNLAIVSLDGTSDGDTVTALLGRVTLENEMWGVSSGVIFLHPCPFPPVGGSLTSFQGGFSEIKSDENESRRVE